MHTDTHTDTPTQRHTHTHTYTHRGSPTNEHTDYTTLNLDTTLNGQQRGLRRMKTAAWKRKHGRSTVSENEVS